MTSTALRLQLSTIVRTYHDLSRASGTMERTFASRSPVITARLGSVSPRETMRREYDVQPYCAGLS
jgi:hypothetical protein